MPTRHRLLEFDEVYNNINDKINPNSWSKK